MPERAGHGTNRDPTDYFATTPQLARFICERIKEDFGIQPELVIEPGCGTGSFLGAIRQTWPQARILGESAGLTFAHVGEGADDPEIAGVVAVMRRHGAELAAEEHRHHQRLGEVVQMLRQRDDVAALLARDAIEDAAAHARR